MIGKYGGTDIYYDYRFSNWLADYYLIKLDSGGNLQWAQNYTGYISEYLDFGNEYASVSQTKDGDYAISCYTYNSTDSGACIIKTDAQGQLKWINYYIRSGLPSDFFHYDDIHFDTIPTKDNNLLLFGAYSYGISNPSNSFYDIQYILEGVMLKIDADGKVLWKQTTTLQVSKQFDGARDFRYFAVEADDGSYAMVVNPKGLYYYTSNSDFCFFRVSSNGAVMSNQTIHFFEPGSDYTFLDSTQFLATEGTTFALNSRMIVTKDTNTVFLYCQTSINSDGTLKQKEAFPVTGIEDSANIQVINDKLVMLSSSADSKLVVIEADKNGVITSKETYTDVSSSVEHFFSSNNGGFIVVGTEGYSDSHSQTSVRILQFGQKNIPSLPMIITIGIVVAIALLVAFILLIRKKHKKSGLNPKNHFI
jgi:hypothetical protein